ncbi:MAG: YkgJ family cysteine cluster protein [Nitrospirae bacterium]|nr:YkgJ family cysteine cluster protein [Nitrospirota bacterium]
MKEIYEKLHKDPDRRGELGPESCFKFNCHKGISCFNKCCGELDIFLSPYDILRMKRRFGKTSGEFLVEYTDMVVTDKNKLPFIKLRMAEGKECKFVTKDGCSIYEDRPLACRYYPLGFAIGKRTMTEGEDFYFLIEESFCKGFKEDKEWVVKDWRQREGIAKYEAMNSDWIEVILNKKLIGKSVVPDDKTISMFILGAYDVDAFRVFVKESKFLQIFDLNDDELQLIMENEEELMKFAHRWLRYALFREPTMYLKNKDNANPPQSGCGCGTCQ